MQIFKAKVFYFSAVSYFNVLLGVLTCIVDKVCTEIASEIAKGKQKFEYVIVLLAYPILCLKYPYDHSNSIIAV